MELKNLPSRIMFYVGGAFWLDATIRESSQTVGLNKYVACTLNGLTQLSHHG